MADQPINKRARANTAGDTNAPPGLDPAAASELRRNVLQLDAETLDGIVIRAAETIPVVHAMVNQAIHEIREKERSRVIDFDFYSKKIWKSINVTYRSMRGSQQFDRAFEVADEITITIDTIASQCGPFANPKTWFNGLSTLRKIGKTIALSSNDTLGHEVQKIFSYNSALEDAMLGIVNAMTPAEREAIRQDESSPEALWPKLKELQALAEDHCILGKLGQVLNLLEGVEADKDENDDEDDDPNSPDDDEVPMALPGHPE